MVDVPTRNTLTSAAKSSGTGVAAGIGETAGRAFLGPGIGTAAGGIVAASMLDGSSREIAASLAVERATNELFAGGSQQSGGVM